MSFRARFRQAILQSYRALAARPSWRHVNELLFDCSIRGLGILNYENESVSGECYLMENLLPRLIRRPDPCFVDIGANVGNYSLALIKAFPQCSLLAIEPQPTVFKILAKNLSPYTRAKALNLGAGSSLSELSLFNYANSEHTEHASLYADVFKDLRPSEAIPIAIQVDRLDTIVQAEKFGQHIDLLKIDTEGHEFEALKGCERLLSEKRISAIQLEFNDVNPIAGYFLRDLRKLLHDFRVFRMLPRGLLTVSETPIRSELFAFQNLLFVHKELEFRV
ncbi:MAG: FkbM family methyltransferase [Pirellulaceae bacterium]|nr:FkbM family methyltransferase [Pirellulaceae bacterium]